MTSVEIGRIVFLLQKRRGLEATVSSFHEYDHSKDNEMFGRSPCIINLCDNTKEDDDQWYIRLSNTWGHPNNILKRNSVVTEEMLLKEESLLKEEDLQTSDGVQESDLKCMHCSSESDSDPSDGDASDLDSDSE
jgi:hypothetical protein